MPLLRILGRYALMFAVVGVVSATITSAASAARVPHLNTGITLTGIVDGPNGHPADHAFVGMGSAHTETNSTGRFKLNLTLRPKVSGFMWAPGAVYDTFTYNLSWIPATETTQALPTFHLTTAFRNTQFDATLGGLKPMMPAGSARAHIRGFSKYSVQNTAFVTLPNGHVEKYHLGVSGQHYAGSIPFKSRGEYQVELLATSGIQVFDIPVFHGIAPFIPTGPKFPRDPKTKSVHALRAFVLSLVNSARKTSHEPSVSMNRRAESAAQAHDTEMAQYGYYYSHPHIGMDGSTVAQRLSRAGVSHRSVGEAVGGGTSLGNVVDSLLMSPAHRMVLTGHFTHAGVGVARWEGLWVVTVDVYR